jgi:hypothetical protein
MAGLGQSGGHSAAARAGPDDDILVFRGAGDGYSHSSLSYGTAVKKFLENG